MRSSEGNLSRFCESVRLAACAGGEMLIGRPFSYRGDARSTLPAQYFSTNHMCLTARDPAGDEVGLGLSGKGAQWGFVKNGQWLRSQT